MCVGIILTFYVFVELVLHDLITIFSSIFFIQNTMKCLTPKKKMIKGINFLVAWWLDSNQNRNCYYELHTCACMHARYHQRTTKYVTNSIFPKPSIRLVDHRQAAHEFSRGFVIMHRFFFAMSHTISPITCHSFFLQLARCTSVFKSERSESSLQNSAKKGLYRVSQQLLDMNVAKNP